MALSKHTWIFMILASIMFHSCGSSRVSTNNSIQKRKYNKGWFFKKGGPTSSAKERRTVDVTPKITNQERVEKLRVSAEERSKPEEVSNGNFLREVMDGPVLSEVGQKMKDIVGIGNSSSSNSEDRLVEESSMNRSEVISEKQRSSEPKEEAAVSGMSVKFIIVLAVTAMIIIGLILVNDEIAFVLLTLLLIIMLIIMLVMGLKRLVRNTRARKAQKVKTE